jgi:hypothetical protein
MSISTPRVKPVTEGAVMPLEAGTRMTVCSHTGISVPVRTSRCRRMDSPGVRTITACRRIGRFDRVVSRMTPGRQRDQPWDVGRA